MSYKYCKHCGEKNQFLAKEPKFCNYCGQSMTGTSVTAQVQTFKQKRVVNEPLEDYESDCTSVPSLSGLQYQVEAFEKKTFKFKELFPKDDSTQEESRQT